ncbi:MAG: hypothetical protein ACREPM_15680 [Gemmatimonadaceae bacterium]
MTQCRGIAAALLTCAAALIVQPRSAAAQSRVGKDSATRLVRFGRDLAYGAVVGLGYAGVDQAFNNPSEWGHGWSGYGRRAASNVGEFVIQEGVTEGLAAAMNRPLDYTPCKCQGFGRRTAEAARQAFTDEMPDGSHRIAVPRIVGAYVGSTAQALWRPAGKNKFGQVLLNGTTSLGLGVFINMFYEFRHKQGSTALTAR